MFSHAALNAFLNGTSGILLGCGYTAIHKGKVQIHERFMISAFAVSTVFLFSYLLYHYRVGHVPFHGQGWIRPVYFALLTSHTILAIVIVLLILITLRRAFLERFDSDHRALDAAFVVLCLRYRCDRLRWSTKSTRPENRSLNAARELDPETDEITLSSTRHEE